MHASLRALLSHIIDYAGLFPPAKLPLEKALATYLHDRKTSPHRWMLGRFVCPVARLGELLTLAQAHADRSLLHIAALGQACKQKDEVIVQIERDVRAIQDFRGAWGADEVIDTYEVALPPAPLNEMRRIASLLEVNQLRGFLEVALTPSWRSHVEALCGSLRDTKVGMKLRTGGVTAEVFPADADVAFFLDRCASARIPWKATAGLHHPCRRWDESLQVWHHGFLNIFGAGLLAASNSLNQEQIVEILSDRDGVHFRFDDEGLAWKSWSCSTTQISELRAGCATTFGCCSFTEPCDDLIAMGLITQGPP